MSKLISYQFNIDTACVELVFDDRSQISIDFTAVENEVADNRFQRSELDCLIYNDPLAYADLILNSKLNVLFEQTDIHGVSLLLQYICPQKVAASHSVGTSRCQSC